MKSPPWYTLLYFYCCVAVVCRKVGCGNDHALLQGIRFHDCCILHCPLSTVHKERKKMLQLFPFGHFSMIRMYRLFCPMRVTHYLAAFSSRREPNYGHAGTNARLNYHRTLPAPTSLIVLYLYSEPAIFTYAHRGRTASYYFLKSDGCHGTVRGHGLCRADAIWWCTCGRQPPAESGIA